MKGIELFKRHIIICIVCVSITPILQAQNGWTEPGGGINQGGFINSIAVDSSHALYAAGAFTDDSMHYYIAKWKPGTSAWTEIGGDDSNALKANNIIKTILVVDSNNIYAAGNFIDTSINYYYVAKWNGTKWIELGTDTSALYANGPILCLAKDNKGNIYAAGNFYDNTSHFFVAKWNGSTWSELGTGGISSHALNANSWIFSITTDAAGNVYAAGAFTDSSGYEYVAKWNGTSWSELGTGANSLNANNRIESITTDKAGNVYAAGDFTDANGYFYVAEWNPAVGGAGGNWTELGGTGGVSANALNAFSDILTLGTDNMGNVYAAGNFFDTSNYTYVAKWNGSSWSELGVNNNALDAIGAINSITVDNAGSVYAGGEFTDDSSSYYVAEYAYTNGVRNICVPNTTSYIYPNPNTGNFIIETSASTNSLIQVYDMLGALVKQQTISGNGTIIKTPIDISAMPAGMYLVKINDGEQQRTIKIIKD